MAGIERLEVHSRSYIVRWIRVDDAETLSWSVQPHKKSINFGIVKHPGNGAMTLMSVSGDDLHSGTQHSQGVAEGKSARFSKKDITAQELLSHKGFISIKWLGKCEADKVTVGTHDVPIGQGGMYGLVFDNTFSKQTSKTITFVVLTYPTGAAPQSSSSLHNFSLPNARWSQASLSKQHTFTRQDGATTGSAESLHSEGGQAVPTTSSRDGPLSASYHVGTLSKRRRKKGQGYARRFFSLDYSTCTLSYYYNRNSSALRGAIPLSLAAIAADERRREISIDSGAEVWHLKAPNDKEFQEWAVALERASRLARGLETVQRPAQPGLRVDHRTSKQPAPTPQEEDVEWQQVEALVSRVVGTRDALRRLTKEVADLPKPSPSHTMTAPGSGGFDDGGDSHTVQRERKSFWKRKSSAPVYPSSTQHSTASMVPLPSPGSLTTGMVANGSDSSRRKARGAQEEQYLDDHCESLLADLDSVVREFMVLINKSKIRRLPVAAASDSASRRSIETTSTTDEFFDAEDAGTRVVKISASEDETHESEVDDASSSRDNSSISSGEEEEAPRHDGADTLYPAKTKSLTPLPIDALVHRRTAIPPATVLPPSLIAFVRKNVGKDLSTISMPVSANEPISLLQKFAEQLEYAQLLDKAAQQHSVTDRLLYVAAFAISQFSSGRAKERAIRKPFNPLLGETFELVRTDKEVPGGFRLLVEKVSHRPVKLAMQAESANWSLSQSPAPGQKFWGKSAEITTDGRVRVALRLSGGTDELYSWNIATMFLRNVVMGEKYVEPVGTMSVVNDTTGHRAAVEFKSKGMFGGRAEDVNVETFGPDGSDSGNGLMGTWTGGLKASGLGDLAGEEIWRVGGMVQNAAQTYGLTAFAASLNEMTEIERDKLPPTDCRLRPDQRLAEQGKLDDAEVWKQRLEEAQRARRRVMEGRGEEHRPRWFVKAEESTEGDEVWQLRTGKEGYWEERARGAWTGVEDIFDVPDE